MDMPITRPRSASWSTDPGLPGPTTAFKLGIDDVHKSNDGLNGLLVIGALGAGLQLLSRMTG